MTEITEQSPPGEEMNIVVIKRKDRVPLTHRDHVEFESESDYSEELSTVSSMSSTSRISSNNSDSSTTVTGYESDHRFIDRFSSLQPRGRVPVTTEKLYSLADLVPDFGILRHLKKWWFNGRVRYSIERASIPASEAHNEPDEIEEEEVTLIVNAKKITPRIRNRYASKVATMCVLALPGVQRDTEANTLVATHFITRQMKRDNVRLAHQRGILAIALLFVRTPMQCEIDAHEMSNTAAFVQPLVDRRVQYYSRDRPWLFNWLGPKVSNRRGGSV